MSTPDAALPARTSFLTHLKRAFSWNLGRVRPSVAEAEALATAGVTDPGVQRYAAWRRSLLLVAFIPTLIVFLLSALDLVEGDLGEYTMLGVGLEVAWVLTTALIALACLGAVRGWRRPGACARLLRVSWALAFLWPLLDALLPESLIYDFHTSSKGLGSSDVLSDVDALKDIALGFMLAGGAFLKLLPSMLAVIPGAVNGCLRIKSLFPGAALPGWLLVWSAPLLLLFWLVLLVLGNQAAQSPLLVFGIMLWAGSPIWYAIRGRVFVQPQLTAADAARIGGVKRVVGLLGLAGIAMLLTFAFTTQVVGLTAIGLDEEGALSPKIDELVEADEVSLEAVGEALDESTSMMYAYDLSSWQLVIDILAKLLLVMAVFADLVLRATLAAWSHDRAARGRTEASAHDASAEAAAVALGT